MDPSSQPRSRRLSDALLAGAVGVVCCWAVLQSLVNHSGWQLAPWLVAVVIAGALLCPVTLSLTGLPQRLARPSAEFWGGGASTWGIAAASLYACASLAWGIAVVVLFGTPPAAR